MKPTFSKFYTHTAVNRSPVSCRTTISIHMGSVSNRFSTMSLRTVASGFLHFNRWKPSWTVGFTMNIQLTVINIDRLRFYCSTLNRGRQQTTHFFDRYQGLVTSTTISTYSIMDAPRTEAIRSWKMALDYIGTIPGVPISGLVFTWRREFLTPCTLHRDERYVNVSRKGKKKIPNDHVA